MWSATWLSQLPGFPSARPAEDVVDDRSAQGASSGEDSDGVTDLILPDDQYRYEEMSYEELARQPRHIHRRMDRAQNGQAQ